MRTIVILSALWLGALPGRSQKAPAKGADSAFKKLDFLLGKWVGVAGEKDTALGAGQGDFSFEPELDGKIIVRRNRSAYDSGARHADLMVIYADAPADSPHAIYFDSEGHVIRYRLTFDAPNAVTFQSDGTQNEPRYRLSYRKNGAALDGKFEIAPPGGEFKTYLSWSSKKE